MFWRAVVTSSIVVEMDVVRRGGESLWVWIVSYSPVLMSIRFHLARKSAFVSRSTRRIVLAEALDYAFLLVSGPFPKRNWPIRGSVSARNETSPVLIAALIKKQKTQGASGRFLAQLTNRPVAASPCCQIAHLIRNG